MVINSCPPDLCQEVQTVRLRWRNVLEAFIAVCADGPEIIGSIRTTLGFIDDVSYGEAHCTCRVERIGISGCKSTHLASIAIPFQNIGACLF